MTDKTYEWDGAPVVQAGRGIWLRQPDGRYRHSSSARTRTPEELAPLKPKPVELHPATTPEPRTVTWRKGEDQTAIREAWKPGRRAQVVSEASRHTVTQEGAITDGFLGIYNLNGWLDGAIDVTSITVWLPEVPKWAQDCESWLNDDRLVATDDGRVWAPIATHSGNIISRWGARGDTEAYRTTDELADMDARLIVDRDGKAVQP